MGDSVTFDVQNAQGEQANCSSIATTFVSNNYDLILANATTALQASAAATSTIPVLGTSVTGLTPTRSRLTTGTAPPEKIFPAPPIWLR